jgi:hypothetical protein
MTVSADARIILERLVYLQRVRTIVLGGFAPGSPKARLHNGELTRHVAAELDREPSPALARDVIQAMRAHGWRNVSHARITWWKGVKRK